MAKTTVNPIELDERADDVKPIEICDVDVTYKKYGCKINTVREGSYGKHYEYIPGAEFATISLMFSGTRSVSSRTAPSEYVESIDLPVEVADKLMVGKRYRVRFEELKGKTVLENFFPIEEEDEEE